MIAAGRALVTGAGGRLGQAMALYLARRGWDVAVHYAGSEAGASLTSADAERTGLQLPVEGSYVVRVTVTDSAGASDEAVHSLTVSAAAPPPTTSEPTGSSGGGGGGTAGWLLPLLLLVAWPWLHGKPAGRGHDPKEIPCDSVDCRTRN